ncbi:MAG: DUF3592 domain-containing protein [Clostridia bacterium]|nr:DUF3592 domain-containing protein [Clostridia bacterium]
MMLYLPIIIFAVTGIVFVVSGILPVVKVHSCKVPVKAYLMEKTRERMGRGTVLSCTFSFRYEGKDYYTKSSLGITGKVHDSLYIGNEYTIYLNEKNPRIFVLERKLFAAPFIMIFFGVFCFALAALFYFAIIA